MSDVPPPVNTWDQLRELPMDGRKRVFICRAMAPGRGSYAVGWHVVGIGFHTDLDPTSAWYDHGMKAFLDRGDKKESLSQAQEWAARTFGYRNEWVMNRMRDYIPAELPVRKLRSNRTKKTLDMGSTP